MSIKNLAGWNNQGKIRVTSGCNGSCNGSCASSDKKNSGCSTPEKGSSCASSDK